MQRIALFTEARYLHLLGSRALACFRLGLNFEDGTSLDRLSCDADGARSRNQVVNLPVARQEEHA